MRNVTNPVRPPGGDENIAPVTILDAQGRVLRVVSAEELRHARPTATAERVDDRRPLASLRAKRAQRRASAESRLNSAAARPLSHAVAS